jgi:hypothetical protein
MCRRRIRVPDNLADKRVTCPRCKEALRAPVESDAPAEAPAADSIRGAATAQAADRPAWSARLGAVASGLGLCAVLVLCLPVVGYAALGLGSVGLLLGLSGLVQLLRERGRGGAVAGGAWGSIPLGTLRVPLPLVGTALCLAALALASLPLFLR